MIGGTHSGAGKTSITLAVVAALTRRGLKVQTFKVGPDFLDPGHLALASGRPCYNLDSWMCERGYVERLLARATADADLAVVEGVMGLFDGAFPDNLEGSTAQMADWLQAPVILVVNTHGMSGSLAALVSGYAGFDPSTQVAGVVANCCGSNGHARGLAAALAARPSIPPLVGAVERGALPPLASRHLGLLSADPNGNLRPEVLAQLADAAEKSIDLDRLLGMARQAPPLNLCLEAPPTVPVQVRLAVARDRAFHFYYQDLIDELGARGCEIVFFSPLEDHVLPEKIDALYLGGGYPEEHAGQLSGNLAMLESIREFAASGRPLYAECGGLIYLSQAIDTLDGHSYPLLGILPARTRMRPSKKFLGYVQVRIKEDCLWGRPGECLRGHEFHYSELLADPSGLEGWRSVYDLQRRRVSAGVAEGFQRGHILASYVHLHLAGRPAAMDHFISLCKRKVKRHDHCPLCQDSCRLP